MIISIDTEKELDKIQHSFMIKTLSNGGGGSIPQHYKGYVQENYSQHHSQLVKIKSFPTKIKKKQKT